MFLDDGAALTDIFGDHVAAKRDDSGVIDDVIVEDGDICSAAAYVDECHASLFLVIAEDRLGRGDRFENHVFHLQASLFDAGDDVACRSDLTDDDMEIGLELAAEHSLRMTDTHLVVNDVFLRDDIDDLLSRRHVQLERILTQFLDFLVGDLHIRVVTHQHATVLFALDVVTGNTHVHRLDIDIRLFGGLLHSTFDGIYGLLNVENHASFHTRRLGLAVTADDNLTILNFFANETGDFCSANIKAYDVHRITHYLLFLLFFVQTT